MHHTITDSYNIYHVLLAFAIALPFTLSIIIAILASITALYFFFKRSQRMTISSLIMVAAISGMHYTSMLAAVMTYPDEVHSAGAIATDMVFVMAVYVAFGTIVIFAVTWIRSLRTDQRLAEQIALQASILESSVDSIMMFNHRGWIIEFNPAAEATFGYRRKEALTRTFFDFLFPFDQDGQNASTLYQQLVRKDTSIIGKPIEMRAYRSDRSDFPAEVTITGIQFKGKPIFTAYLRDLTEKKKSEKNIHQLAYFDLLTGLPNRNQFNQVFLETLDIAQVHNQSVAILFLDVNRFKLINDTLGHTVGDQVLQKFSALLSRSLEKHNIVFRLSGDEFVILYPHGNRETSSKQAEKIIEQLETPFRIGGRDVFISTSIGISLYPIDGESPEILLKNADHAMYSAKERGKNNYRFFDPDMNFVYARKIEIEQSLRHALENKELSLSYQPQFHIPTGKIIGVEALARWDSPNLGSISPKEFIPIAEESGLIVSIGEWVLQTACTQMKKWQDAGMERVPIAVNLSTLQFHQERLVETIVDNLYHCNLEPQYLELEITESIASNKDRSCIIEKLNALKRLGVRISLNDFGIGYSSLSYLRMFPIHTLKIDRSFVHDISTVSEDSSIVEVIIALARSLRLNVLATGVETKQQFEFLEKHGCQQMQGYMFCVPLNAEQFEANYVINNRFSRTHAL